MIGRCGERGSGISVLAARHDDDKKSCKDNGVHTFSQGYLSESNYFYSVIIIVCSVIWF